MEYFLCVLLCLMILYGESIEHVKTAASSIWLLITFIYFIMEPVLMEIFISYVRYAFLAFIGIIFTYVIAVPLTPLALLFVRSNGFLPTWLCWLQTFDATVDAAWQASYASYLNANPSNWWQALWTYRGAPNIPTGLNKFCLRLQWLWRNPAYGFDFWPLGIVYDDTQWIIKTCDVTNGTLTRFYAVTKDGKYFSYTDSTGKKFGWKLWWALDANFQLIPADKFTHVADPASGYNQGKRLMFVFTP